MMTGITYIFFQVVYCLAEEEKTINPLTYNSPSPSLSLSLSSLSLIYFTYRRSGFCLWEITYNQLSNYKQKDHCRIRETFLLLKWQTRLSQHFQGNIFATYFNRNYFSTQQAMKICIAIYIKTLNIKRMTNDFWVSPFLFLLTSFMFMTTSFYSI